MKLKGCLLGVLAALALGSAVSADTRLEVSGGDGELRGRLEAASLLLRESAEGESPTVQDTIAAARADYARLLSALYDAGYFAPVIRISLDGREAARLSPFDEPPRIDDIVIRVDPGRPFTLGRAEIGPLAPQDTPPEAFRPGAPASTGVLREAASSAVTGWRQVGHATAAVAGQQLTARHSDAELDAVIAIDPGPRLRFGPLRPTGQERMPADRVRQIAGLPEGEVFDPDELNRAGNRLRSSGVFSTVALREGEPTADGRLPIDATLVPAPLRRLGFGAELSSIEGATLSAYWIHRNLLGDGERLRLDFSISQIGQEESPDIAFGARLSRPATITPDTTAEINFALELLDEPDFEENFVEIGVGLDHVVTEGASGSLGIGLRYSDISDAFGEREVTLLTLPAAIYYDRRDDPLDPREGYYAEIELTPFYITGSGDAGILSAFEARGYLGFGEDNRTRLAGRLQLGSLNGGSVRELPADYLFYSGGGGTVRGQDYRSLGAIQDGVESGGRGFLGLSGEVRHDINDRFGIVGFADAGFISAEPLGGEGEWHAGAGLGLRYQTGFGALRVDVGVPVSGDDPGSSVFFYIGIGEAF